MRALPSFFRDDHGGVLVYVTVVLAAIFGVAALVIDLGRLASTQSELQSFADNLALAMAGELDANPDAITRANNVLARGEWQDRQTFGDGAAGLTAADVTVRYLSGLPADDEADLGGFVTTDARQAGFVEVTVNPRAVASWFARVVNGLTGGGLAEVINTAATAVAGFDQYICDITPLMFCAPNTNYTPVPGRMIALKSSNSWGPGAFGLLDVDLDPDGPCGPPNQGGNYLRCAVAVIENVTQCFSRRGVSVRPGQVTGGVAQGFNTRFDMYTGSLGGLSSNANFAPAPNVVRGFGRSNGTGCVQNLNNVTQYADSTGLPKDACFGTGDTCGGSAFGNGTWDRAGYLATNHNGAAISGSSRYEIYLNEIAAAAGGRILPAGKTESGAPTCSTQAPASADRRVLLAAAVNCAALPPGNASNVPVLKYVRMFMTQPAGDDGGSNSSIWVEEIGEATPYGAGAAGGSGLVHYVVQLYR